MDKIEKSFARFDRKVDQKIGSIKQIFRRYFPIFSTLVFALFVVVFVLRIFYTRPELIASIIEDDVKLITLALEKIDAKCNILSVERDQNDVDFLNVKAFAGSQVGPLNLAYPQRWQGPYLHTNPTLQERFYRIVRAKDGIFVIPGDGVHLPNGLVVGKDFAISSEVSIAELLKEGGALTYKKRVMGSKLLFKVGDWDPWHMKEKTVKKIDYMLKEFNSAMPFTENETKTKREIYRA